MKKTIKVAKKPVILFPAHLIPDDEENFFRSFCSEVFDIFLKRGNNVEFGEVQGFFPSTPSEIWNKVVKLISKMPKSRKISYMDECLLSETHSSLSVTLKIESAGSQQGLDLFSGLRAMNREVRARVFIDTYILSQYRGSRYSSTFSPTIIFAGEKVWGALNRILSGNFSGKNEDGNPISENVCCVVYTDEAYTNIKKRPASSTYPERYFNYAYDIVPDDNIGSRLLEYVRENKPKIYYPGVKI